jgi:amino acid adenylation domain-containing protein
VDTLHISERAGRAHRALNAPAVDYPDRSSIPEIFRLCAAEYGDRSAVVHADRTVDYRTLDLWSDRLAARLLAAGVGPGKIVGVCVRRSPELVAGLLAVLKCGAAYLPFSETWPDQRLHDVLEQAGCAVVLTDREEQLAARLGEVCTVPAHEAAAHDAPVPAVAAEHRPASAAPLRVPPDAIAYVNFTSGSQGQPKGVLIEHRAVIELVSAAVYARLDRTRRLLHLAPVTFDAATFEIWGALLNGGTCVLYPSEFPRLSELRRVIVEQRVTTVFLTTALFNSIVDEAPQTLDTVDEILTGGETHSLRHIGTALDRYGPGRVVHVYGPTESTTFATWHPVCVLPADGRSLPIGLPVQNARAYVVNGMRLCAPGETGELLLAGHGLSPGYLGMPEATAERFVEHRIAGIAERLYRTGDLVRIDGEGRLVFEGRSDDQVKINGFRIEPGEVAHHLDRDPAIRQSFVCTHDGPAGRALLAFVVPADPGCTAASVRKRLAATLPAYMLPAEIHLCPALPLSPTGKVDRQVLIAQSATRRERPRS